MLTVVFKTWWIHWIINKWWCFYHLCFVTNIYMANIWNKDDSQHLAFPLWVSQLQIRNQLSTLHLIPVCIASSMVNIVEQPPLIKDKILVALYCPWKNKFVSEKRQFAKVQPQSLHGLRVTGKILITNTEHLLGAYYTISFSSETACPLLPHAPTAPPKRKSVTIAKVLACFVLWWQTVLRWQNKHAVQQIWHVLSSCCSVTKHATTPQRLHIVILPWWQNMPKHPSDSTVLSCHGDKTCHKTPVTPLSHLAMVTKHATTPQWLHCLILPWWQNMPQHPSDSTVSTVSRQAPYVSFVKKQVTMKTISVECMRKFWE